MENKVIKLFYGSSPDRGLEHLLKMWPQIRQELPGCELHNCYGFELFLKGYANNPYMMNWYNEMQTLLKQDGITDYGRVSKEKVDEITRMCDIWAYPTHFSETFGITAVRCQQLRCVPVTMNLAGLTETVFSGIKLEGDIYEAETKELFFKELVSLAKDEKRLEEEKQKGMAGIEKYYWDNVSVEWSKLF